MPGTPLKLTALGNQPLRRKVRKLERSPRWANRRIQLRSLILRCFGYTVLEADSRGEAWSVCAEHRGPIRLIMMETSLNHDSAYEFITRLQLVHPQVRALLLTDASSARMLRNSLCAASTRFFKDRSGPTPWQLA